MQWKNCSIWRMSFFVMTTSLFRALPILHFLGRGFHLSGLATAQEYIFHPHGRFRWSASSLSALEGCHRDDNITSFMTGFDIMVRFSGLFQQIALIDDRLDLPIVDELFEKQQIFFLLA